MTERAEHIAENLHRADLTALERAEQIAEWVRPTESKVILGQNIPKIAKDGTTRGRPEGGAREVSRILPNIPGKTPEAKRKAVDRAIKVAAVRELGIDRTEAHRAVKVASISDEAKEAHAMPRRAISIAVMKNDRPTRRPKGGRFTLPIVGRGSR